MGIPTSSGLRVSVLDQSPVSEGSTGSQALQNTIDLARLADGLGYHRYWVAEHHGGGMVAGPSPEVLIGPIAAATTNLRVGSGGVMLPHYSPLKVAENFSILGRAVPRPHRPRHRPRRRHRCDDDVRAAARPPPGRARRLPRAARRAPGAARGPHAVRPSLLPAHASCPACPRRRCRGCWAPRCRARSGRPSRGCRTRSPTSSTRAARRTRSCTGRASAVAPHRHAEAGGRGVGDRGRLPGGGGAAGDERADDVHAAAPRAAHPGAAGREGAAVPGRGGAAGPAAARAPGDPRHAGRASATSSWRSRASTAPRRWSS